MAWGAVFAGERGDLVLIGWSAALFVAASVAAGGMGIIVGSEGINLERDMHARRFVRGFAISSAIMILVAIILLSIAAAQVNPKFAQPPDAPASPVRMRAMSAAGWFTTGAVVVEVSLAVAVRVIYSTTPYHW